MTATRWAVGGLGAGLLVLCSLPLGLNGDLQYVLGGLRVHEAGDPLRFIDTFTHRPIAYRAILSFLSDLLRLIGIGPERMALFEGAARAVGVAVASGTGWSLWLGLRSRLGRAEAGGIGLTAGLALALAPNFDFLQPEWFAAVFLALSVAAGLGVRREAVAGLLAGVLLTLAVAVKLATAPIALCGLLLICLVDRRRAVLAMLGGLVGAGAWLAAVMATPHEWRWMGEMAALNPHSLLRDPPGLTDAANALRTLGAKLAVTPVLIVVPASLVMIGRTLAGRSRWAAPLGLLLALGLASAPMLIQSQWFLYHLAQLPVLGAGIVGFAAVRWWRHAGRPPWLLLVTLPPLAAWSTLALSLPAAWRDANAWGVILGLLLAGLTLAAAPWAMPDLRPGPPAPRSHPQRVDSWPLAALAVAALLAVAPALVPPAAWSPDSAHTPYTNQAWATFARAMREDLQSLARRLPAGSRVVYLAYGDVAYHVGAATDCRYPSPLWVQRTAFFGYVRSFDSYAENLACITAGSEPYVLIQPHWLRPDRITEEARAAIDAAFDCGGAPQAARVQLCRRR